MLQRQRYLNTPLSPYLCFTGTGRILTPGLTSSIREDNQSFLMQVESLKEDFLFPHPNHLTKASLPPTVLTSGGESLERWWLSIVMGNQGLNSPVLSFSSRKVYYTRSI